MVAQGGIGLESNSSEVAKERGHGDRGEQEPESLSSLRLGPFNCPVPDGASPSSDADRIGPEGSSSVDMPRARHDHGPGPPELEGHCRTNSPLPRLWQARSVRWN